jgi:hypothetical protein
MGGPRPGLLERAEGVVAGGRTGCGGGARSIFFAWLAALARRRDGGAPGTSTLSFRLLRSSLASSWASVRTLPLRLFFWLRSASALLVTRRPLTATMLLARVSSGSRSSAARAFTMASP